MDFVVSFGRIPIKFTVGEFWASIGAVPNLIFRIITTDDVTGHARSLALTWPVTSSVVIMRNIKFGTAPIDAQNSPTVNFIGILPKETTKSIMANVVYLYQNLTK